MIPGAAARRLVFTLAVPALAGVAGAVSAADTAGRIVFKNNLPEVKVQDDEAGIFFVKVVLYGDGPLDPNTSKPDFSKLPELKTITYGKPIEGKNLPGSSVDISKSDLDARKSKDPNTLILTDESRKRTIYEGPIPKEAAWVKLRYDTAIFTRKQGSHFPGARNWIAIRPPVLPEDRWTKLKSVPDACPTLVIEITALVKGIFPDERDFTTEVDSRCE